MKIGRARKTKLYWKRICSNKVKYKNIKEERINGSIMEHENFVVKRQFNQIQYICEKGVQG